MRRWIYVICLCVISICSLFSIYIEQITDISDGVMLFEHDFYFGAITGYGDRVIVQNAYSIEEFIISDDGSLDRVNRFETKLSMSAIPFVYGDRYYTWRNINQHGSNYELRVFDLSTCPMVEILDTGISIETKAVPNIKYFDQYILFTHVYDWWVDGHGHTYPAWETLKICKNTFTILDTLNFSANVYTRNSESVFSTLTDPFETHLTLTFCNLVDFQLEYISDLDLPLERPREMYFSGSNYIITYEHRVIVVDISNIEEPFILHDMTVQPSEFYFHNSVFTGQNIICSDSGGRLLIFETSVGGDFPLISIKPHEQSNPMNNIYFKTPFLFTQSGSHVNVYDSGLPYFDKIHAYGYENYFSSYTIFLQPNDLYHIRFDHTTQLYSLYSVLRNELIANLLIEDAIYQYDVLHIQHLNDMLYIATHVRAENANYFHIYQLVDEQAVFVDKFPIPMGVLDFVMNNNNVFLNAPSQNTVYVYRLENNTLTFLDSFTGGIQSRFGSQPDNYLINHHNNLITIRDIANYENILYQQTVPESNAPTRYFGDNYFLVNLISSGQFRVMKYDTENENIYQIHQFELDTRYDCFNKVISNNANNYREISEYFTIINDTVVKIGEKVDKNRSVYMTLFYPENHKMIQLAHSGIWVYDIDYRVSDNDFSLLPLKNELLSNYPNPFNPETTISFSIKFDSDVKIDIFNIRGQKVKSLINEFKTSGNHQVIWNGTDENGLSVSSGIYFYRIQTSDFTATKRMVLLK